MFTIVVGEIPVLKDIIRRYNEYSGNKETKYI